MSAALPFAFDRFGTKFSSSRRHSAFSSACPSGQLLFGVAELEVVGVDVHGGTEHRPHLLCDDPVRHNSKLPSFDGDAVGAHPCGGVAERSKALVLKTSEGRPSQGSNPCPSANFSIKITV